jgi:hypothetical protein
MASAPETKVKAYRAACGGSWSANSACDRESGGLTPISRRRVKTANESLVALATIVAMVPRCGPARTRFFVVLAANRIAPNTHQVQAPCRLRKRPGTVCAHVHRQYACWSAGIPFAAICRVFRFFGKM